MMFILGRNHLKIETLVANNCQQMLVDIADT